MSAAKDRLKVFPFEQAMLKKLNIEGHRSLIDMFERSCSEHASNPAFTAIGQNMSFAELEEKSRQFAAFLTNECRLQPGHRIAIQLPNLNQYPIGAVPAQSGHHYE